MATAASQTPVRYPSGVSTDMPYQPLAMFGNENPFMYNTLEDDFNSLSVSWTATKTSAGTIASTPGAGGLLLFTTNASTPLATDICSIQNSVASFNLSTAMKKDFFLTRLQLSSATNAAFMAGLIQTTATPFTVTDGVYFYKATGSLSNLVLISTVGSTPVSLTIPTTAYTLANTTNIDLGFYIDRNNTIFAFVGAQLVGFIPQSGSGTIAAIRGPAASFAPAITSANLNPTVAIQSGTAASSTMTVDFLMAAMER